MTEILDFLNSRLKIDPNNLDLELIEQPELYSKAATEYAMAVSRKDELKENLKSLNARLSLNYRKSLDEAGKKTTDSLITSCVETDDEYLKLKQEFLDSAMMAEVLLAMRDSFSQRSWMLRELCALQVNNLLSKNAVYSNDSTIVAEVSNNKNRAQIRAAK